ncbi:MAG: hypothetical protein JWO02_3911 [Solirubrobacterales bacterium]|nr:hypothetical protein [Solirubrobacterales bacterium]
MSRVRSCALALTAACAAGVLPVVVAAADEPIATTTTPLRMSADAGVVVWAQRQGDDTYRFVVSSGGATPATIGPRLGGEPIFDVARGRGRKAAIVWTQGCSMASHRCTVRTLAATGGSMRTLTRIPYAGGGSPAITQHGRRIAYTLATFRRAGRRRVQCDVPYTRVLTGAATPARPRRLDRGTCARIRQLDLEGSFIGVLAAMIRPDDSQTTEARVLPVTGGRSRTLQRESQGQESNSLDAIALDGALLYTARDGFHQPNVFTRLNPRTGARTEARAFTALVGGFARDGGRQYYVQNGSGGGDIECPGANGTPCVVVAGSDPFAPGTRLLPPVLSMLATPTIVYADTPLQLGGTLVRRRATRTRVLGSVPLGGVPVALSTAILGPRGSSAFSPTGTVVDTRADGSWSVTLTPPHIPRTGYLTTAGAPGTINVGAPAALYPSIWVHMTVTSAARSSDGVVTVSGTIDPPQPGRVVRLDRRVALKCNLPYALPGTTPSTIDTPANCLDIFTRPTAATTPVSADGTRFTVSRPGPAGFYRATLDVPGSAALYAGETAQVQPSP